LSYKTFILQIDLIFITKFIKILEEVKEMKKKIIVFGIVIMLLLMSVVSLLVVGLNAKTNINKNERILPTNDRFLFYPTDDSMINMRAINNNYGDLLHMKTRNRYGGDGADDWEANSLIKFDLSSIRNNYTINYASLYVYYYDYDSNKPTGRNLTCHRIIEDWDETTVTYANRPDISVTVTDTAIVPNTYKWMVWNVTHDVQKIINGEYENYGWQLMDEKYWGSWNIPVVKFRTKEYVGKEPYLVVDLIGSRVITDLCKNWNLISNPHIQDVKITSLMVKYNNVEYNWTQSTTDDNPTGHPIISPFISYWTCTTQSYSFTNILYPDKGYWIYAHEPCILEEKL
jgi:hypothetical protein